MVYTIPLSEFHNMLQAFCPVAGLFFHISLSGGCIPSRLLTDVLISAILSD